MTSLMIHDANWQTALKAAQQNGQDIFAFVLQHQQQVYRDVAGRKTFSLLLNGQRYFVKYHSGVGWREIIKNLSQGKRPIISARTEYQALQALNQLGVLTPQAVAWAERGVNPATRKSLLITRDIGQFVTLEDFIQPWAQQPPKPALRQALILAMAQVAKQMHSHGLYHRDFYLCHLCLPSPLHQSANLLKASRQPVQLLVMDLHRCVRLARPNKTWAMKDIAALYFSSMSTLAADSASDNASEDEMAGASVFSAQDWQLFAQHYCYQDAAFWQRVQRRAARLYGKFHSAKFQQRLQQEQARLHQP